MISEREKYERFENYLKGLMNQEAKAAFENDLKQQAELNREFGDYKQAHRLIFDSALLDLRQELTTLHAAELKTSRFWHRIRNFVIPAGIIVTGILLYFYLNRHNELRPEKSIPKEAAEKVENMLLPAGSESQQVTVLDSYVNTVQPGKKSIVSTRSHEESITDVNQLDKSVDIVSGPVKTIPKPVGADPLLTKKTIPVMVADTFVSVKGKMPDDEKTNPPSLIDCEQVSISCEFVTENTCAGRGQGKIVFLTNSLKGGNPPYEFSINGGAIFEGRTLFDNLQSGNYRLVIRDATKCTSAAGTAVVDKIECDFRFAPGLGEVWEIPFITDKDGKLFIFSKEGRILYTTGIGPSSNRTWDGKSSEGNMLPFGVYLFRLEFQDGSRYNGSVTIIK